MLDRLGRENVLSEGGFGSWRQTSITIQLSSAGNEEAQIASKNARLLLQIKVEESLLALVFPVL